MSGPNDLLILGVYVVFRVVFLIWVLWDMPLEHGAGFFLGVEVAPGFYDGPGIQWMKRYRRVLVAEHVVEGALLAVLAWRNLYQLTMAVPLGAGLTLGGFVLWARGKVGAAPRKITAVAGALETRRLSDYISWPMEALTAVTAAAAWALLFRAGHIQLDWPLAFMITYGILAFFHLRIVIAREPLPPLPTDRSEEYRRRLEAYRQYPLRILTLGSWSMTT